LKEAADRWLLHQPLLRGVNTSLAIMTVVISVVMTTALMEGLLPHDPLTVGLLAGTAIAGVFCTYQWLHRPQQGLYQQQHGAGYVQQASGVRGLLRG